jgi:hypothetical protein
MKKGMGLIAGALALAGLGASAQVTQTLATKTGNEIQATAKTREAKKKFGINNLTGGLDMPRHYGMFGMTPKEYGIRFGTGKSKKWKSNRNRYAHNAKVSRRRAA